MKRITSASSKEVSPSTNPAGAEDIDALAGFYVRAGKSANTERTYKSHIKHYEDDWGGELPATSDAIIKYISTYARTLKVTTLRARLSALSKWHKDHTFADPTNFADVRAAIKGIAKHHNGMTKQAYPLTLSHLFQICDRLEAEKKAAVEALHACSDQAESSAARRDANSAILRTHRDLALVLIGFWQAFRSDELSRVTVENVVADRHVGMRIFLSYSKADKNADGTTFDLPVLTAYCPTSAYLDWVQVSGLSSGLVFRSISRWGKIAATGIHRQSIEHILNRVAADLFPNEPKFTTHSLRRGFADFAVRQGWDLSTIMSHVGWLSMDSARKYMPIRKDFGALAMHPQSNAISGSQGSSTGMTLIGQFHRTDGD